MPQQIQVPGMGIVEFPDSMNDTQIAAAIRSNMSTAEAKPAAAPAPEAVPEFALVKGVGRGVKDFGEGLEQSSLRAGEALKPGVQSAISGTVGGIASKFGIPEAITGPVSDFITDMGAKLAMGNKSADQFTRQVDKERAAYEATPEAKTTAGQVGRLVGGTAPYMIGGPLSLAGRLAVGTAAGASQYVPEGGSRGLNAGLSAALYAALPPVLKGLASKNPYIKGGTGAALGAGTAGLLSGGDYTDMGISAGVGALLPFAPRYAARGAQALYSKVTGQPVSQSADPLVQAAAMNMLQGVDQKAAEKALRAARKLDLDYAITPAETGSQIAAGAQGALGTSKPGAQLLYDFGKKRQGQEKQIVNNFLDDIAPDSKNAAVDVRDIAKGIQSEKEAALIQPEQKQINDFLNKLTPNSRDVSPDVRRVAQTVLKKQEQQLKDQSQPIYEQAHKELVDQQELDALMSKDHTIKKAINNTLTDPHNFYDLNGYAQNSIKVLDLAKQRIDAWIDKAKPTPIQNGNKMRYAQLTAAKERLIAATDAFSPTYKTARAVYGENAAPLAHLRNSNVGKLASLDDRQLKNASKTIFDPGQTDIATIAELRSTIGTENPRVWRGIIRNEIDRRLNAVGPEAERSGGVFYKKVLGNERDYQQFMEAAKLDPALTKQLTGLRSQFSNSAQTLKELRSTDIARLGNLSDPQLKSLSHNIFDNAQTSAVFKSYRDQISAKSPDAWRRIVRHELDRRMNTAGDYAAGSTAGDYAGATFYDKMLRNDRDFNQFLLATRGIPGAAKKLIYMRRAFKDLINPVSVATAARLSKTSMTTEREPVKAAKNIVMNFAGGKYDQAAIKLITSNKWDKEFKTIQAIKETSKRSERMADLLGRITGLEAANLQSPHNDAGALNVPVQ